MSQSKIDFNRPSMVGHELDYIAQAVEAGQISGDGVFTRRCHQQLENILGAPKVLLTTSCTHALELSALLLRVQPGDEVIVPDFTFVSTINAFVLRGCKPVFVDIRPDTLNLDEDLLERAVSPKTKVILPVHYAGVACEMDQINAIAADRHIPVVEDNAHGLFGKYKNRNLGTLGCMATQSFHETKNIMCGEGGALVINDPVFIEEAEIIREKGTDRSRFFRGQVDKYSWVDLGSSYLPSDILAAFLFAQLENWQKIQERRKEIWEFYAENLGSWAERSGVRLPVVPAECEQPYHMFYMLLPNLEKRQALIAHLKESGIHSVFHYLPLHLSTMGQKWGGRVGDCPVTERVSDQLLRLPFYYSLSQADQERVVEEIKKFKGL